METNDDTRPSSLSNVERQRICFRIVLQPWGNFSPARAEDQQWRVGIPANCPQPRWAAEAGRGFALRCWQWKLEIIANQSVVRARSKGVKRPDRKIMGRLGCMVWVGWHDAPGVIPNKWWGNNATRIAEMDTLAQSVLPGSGRPSRVGGWPHRSLDSFLHRRRLNG